MRIYPDQRLGPELPAAVDRLDLRANNLPRIYGILSAYNKGLDELRRGYRFIWRRDEAFDQALTDYHVVAKYLYPDGDYWERGIQEAPYADSIFTKVLSPVLTFVPGEGWIAKATAKALGVVIGLAKQSLGQFDTSPEFKKVLHYVAAIHSSNPHAHPTQASSARPSWRPRAPRPAWHRRSRR
jgi:hypothetical protein